MTSRRLFVDLLSENRKRRLWPIALSITGNFFSQIVFAFLVVGVYENRLANGYTTLADIRLEFFKSIAGASSIPVLLILFGFALINALQGFSYLFDTRMSDLYGAIPVKREQIFDSVCLNGVFIFGIPYIICHVLTVAFGVIKGYVTISSIPAYILSAITVLIMYCMVYMICVLAAIMTGHIVVAALAAGTFSVIGIASYYALLFYKQEFFMSYVYENSSDTYQLLSPFTACYMVTSRICNNQEVAYQYAAFPYVGIILLISLVLYVLSRYLIRIRPSEAAGKAIAFSVTKPYIKCIISIVTTLYAGLLFYEIGNQIGGLFFGIISGLILTHAVMETIFAFDFKASFKHFGSLIVTATVTMFIVLSFLFDFFQYDSYLPATSRIESVAISDDFVYSGMVSICKDKEYELNESIGRYKIRTMKLSDIEDVDILSEAGARYCKEHRLEMILGDFSYDGSYGVMDVEDSGERYYNIEFLWHLKDGKTVARSYFVNLDDEDMRNAYGRIFDTKEYKDGSFAIFNAEVGDFDSLQWSDLEGIHDIDIPEADRRELIDALSKDLKNQSFDDVQNERATLEIQLLGKANASRYNYNDTTYSFYVFPSYVNTIAFLEKHGIPARWDEAKDRISVLGVGLYDEEGEGYWETSTNEEVIQLLDAIEVSGLNSANYGLIYQDYEDDSFVYGSLNIPSYGDIFGITIDTKANLPQGLMDEIERVYKISAREDATKGHTGWVSCLSNEG